MSLVATCPFLCSACGSGTPAAIATQDDGSSEDSGDTVVIVCIVVIILLLLAVAAILVFLCAREGKCAAGRQAPAVGKSTTFNETFFKPRTQDGELYDEVASAVGPGTTYDDLPAMSEANYLEPGVNVFGAGSTPHYDELDPRQQPAQDSTYIVLQDGRNMYVTNGDHTI